MYINLSPKACSQTWVNQTDITGKIIWQLHKNVDILSAVLTVRLQGPGRYH